jgi:hypothetical protein
MRKSRRGNCLPVFSLRFWPDIDLEKSSLLSHDHTLCGGQNKDIAIITLHMLFKEGGGTNQAFSLAQFSKD